MFLSDYKGISFLVCASLIILRDGVLSICRDLRWQRETLEYHGIKGLPIAAGLFELGYRHFV
jgi:hypothetical protein